MGLFKKSFLADTGADECEHILGVFLSGRKRFINFSGIAQDNVYAGIVIGQAFTTNIEKLDDEFDALSIFYVWKALSELNANEADFMQGASAVFDNFDINEDLRKLYSYRINEYSNLDTKAIGIKFLENIASIYQGKVEKNDPEILEAQLNKFHKILQVNIKRELSAKNRA